MLIRTLGRCVGCVICAATVAMGTADAQERGRTTQHSALPQIVAGSQTDWPLHNLDIRGTRFADTDEIDTANVNDLALAWSFAAGAANSITQANQSLCWTGQTPLDQHVMIRDFSIIEETTSRSYLILLWLRYT